MERGDRVALAVRAPEPKRWYQRHRALALAATMVLLAALGVVAYLVTTPALAVYAVTRGALVQTIAASGRVQTPQRVEVGTQITGTVAAIPVQEGQSVKAGDALILLDAGEARATVAQAQASVAQAQARLRQLREFSLPMAAQALRQTQANLQTVRRQTERSQQLYARGFIGQAQLDEAQRNLETAESQLRTAQLQVRTNQPTGSDYLLAEAALAQADAGWRVAQAKLAYATIKAPVDGTLIDRNVERGYVVQPGKALMVLSPAGATQLVAQIDERNLARLRPGQTALASADAYPEQRFAARLVYINPGVDAQRGSVEVKFDVPQPPAYLRQDMTVSVDVEITRRDDTVVVPADAIQDAGGAAPWVWKAVDGRARRQAVKLGARDASRMEVLDGVQAGDRLLAGAKPGVREGQRVRTGRVAPAAGAR